MIHIIKNNLYIIEKACVEHKRFKDNIWERLLENNIKIKDQNNYVNYVKSDSCILVKININGFVLLFILQLYIIIFMIK